MNDAIPDTLRSPPPVGMTIRPDPVVKVCACGEVFSASQWSALRYVGEQDDGVERIELRNCPCGSTIAILLEDHRAAP
jgi:hypothetical protein